VDKHGASRHAVLHHGDALVGDFDVVEPERLDLTLEALDYAAEQSLLDGALPGDSKAGVEVADAPPGLVEVGGRVLAVPLLDLLLQDVDARTQLHRLEWRGSSTRPTAELRNRFYEALDRAELHRLTFRELRPRLARRWRPPGAAERDPGIDGSRRRQHNRDLRHYAPDPTHGAAFAQRAFGDRRSSLVEASEAPQLDGR